jgi:hypothetical protein
MIEPIGRGVLDTRLRGYDDLLCGEWIASFATTTPEAEFKIRTIRNKTLLRVSGDCASYARL